MNSQRLLSSQNVRIKAFWYTNNIMNWRNSLKY